MYTPKDQKLYEKIKVKVKSKVARWPSAYASGQVVQQYKAAFKKKYGETRDPYVEKKEKTGTLARWYKEEWVDLCRPKKGGRYQPCGRSVLKGTYPFCRPLKRIDKGTPMTVGEVIKKFGISKLEERCIKKQKARKTTLPSAFVLYV
jgi:hypothetical protein